MNQRSIFIKLILVVLTLAIMVSSLSACKKGGSVASSSDEAISSEENSSVDDTAEQSSNEESSDDIYFEDEPTEETDSEDTGSDEELDLDLDLDIDLDLDDLMATAISVHNGSKPILENYRGVSGTVYMPYTFWETNGVRHYTDEMADIEFNRLETSGFKIIRTYYKHSLAWDTKKQRYDFDKQEMVWYRKWAKELQDRGLEISLGAPMRDESFAQGVAGWENEADYILGYGDDKFGECADAGIDFTGMSEDEIRINKAGARVAYWINESLINGFKAYGINNITHINYCTEADNPFTDGYTTMLSLLHKDMEKRGIRKQYKIIGPNKAEYQATEDSYQILTGVMEYMNTTGEQIVDVLSAHVYPDTATLDGEISDDFINDIVYYSEIWKQLREENNYTGEFWMDEYNLGFKDLQQYHGQIEHTHNSGWIGTQFAATMCRAVEAGINNTFIWCFADQRWDGNSVQYVGGITPPILYSQEPYLRYYAYTMIARAFGYQNGKVYQTDDMYFLGNSAMCVELEDGNWVLMVVNTGLEELTFEAEFEKAIGKNMFRHLYTPTMMTELVGKQIPADKGFKNVTTTLKDTIPIGGVAIYTSVMYE